MAATDVLVVEWAPPGAAVTAPTGLEKLHHLVHVQDLPHTVRPEMLGADDDVLGGS